MKIKKDFWKCQVDGCNFQTTLIKEADKHSMAIINQDGIITKEAHELKNLRGLEIGT